MVSFILSTYFVFISLVVYLVSFIKNLIISNTFYVVLTPSTHGEFYCICVLLKVKWGMDKVPIYLCCWHVLKAWHLHGIEKIKDVEVRGGIL